MRVALIHHQFKLKGGMETYLFNLISGFNQEKDQVTVFVYKHDKTESAMSCEVDCKRLFWLPRTLRKYWFGAHLYKRKKVRAHDFRLSLMRSFYQDMIICGGTHQGYLNNINKAQSLNDKMEIACERKSYNTSSIIIAHSSLLRKELIELYGICAEKIVMCYPPIDTMKFNVAHRSQREALRKKFNIHPSRVALLFPSTGHRRKGFYALIEALNSLPTDEFELIVAGNQPPITAYPNVKYVGFVDDMALLYAACDVTLLPSLYEPFGLVIIESLACGTPVILSKHVGAKDLVTEREGIILDDLMPSTIASAIESSVLKKFEISPTFAQDNHLTIDLHIRQLKTMLISKAALK